MIEARKTRSAEYTRKQMRILLILLQIVAYKEGRESQGHDNVDKIFYWEPAKKCHKVFQRRKIIRPFEISVF